MVLGYKIVTLLLRLLNVGITEGNVFIWNYLRVLKTFVFCYFSDFYCFFVSFIIFYAASRVNFVTAIMMGYVNGGEGDLKLARNKNMTNSIKK